MFTYKNVSTQIDLGQLLQILESVCTQLFSFYRSKEVELQRFTLQFVPTLVYNYLSSIVQGHMKTYRCIETLLIGNYILTCKNLVYVYQWLYSKQVNKSR